MVHLPSSLAAALHQRNLNTSYVMVHYETFGLKWAHIDLFKYILCYGSSHTEGFHS